MPHWDEISCSKSCIRLYCKRVNYCDYYDYFAYVQLKTNMLSYSDIQKASMSCLSIVK